MEDEEYSFFFVFLTLFSISANCVKSFSLPWNFFSCTVYKWGMSNVDQSAWRPEWRTFFVCAPKRGLRVEIIVRKKKILVYFSSCEVEHLQLFFYSSSPQHTLCLFFPKGILAIFLCSKFVVSVNFKCTNLNKLFRRN